MNTLSSVSKKSGAKQFIDAPSVDPTKQRKPSFTAEQVTAIVKAATGRLQMAAILFATTGCGRANCST